MPSTTDNLFPTDHLLRTPEERAAQIGQRPVVVWLFGLSGSGKTTLANALDRRLAQAGRLSFVLDGDNVRTGLNAGLGFSDADRRENIRRVAEVSKLLLQAGLVVINSFITPRREMRELARSIIGGENLMEVFVHASFETCAQRDPKGIYARAASGGVQSFTGKDSTFENPENADLTLNTEQESLEESLSRLWAVVSPRLSLER